MHDDPESHPLDFDWRFDSETIDELLRILPNKGPILALGCPSLVKRLAKSGRVALLVDRQPIHYLENHVELDLQVAPPPFSGFSASIIDPPWYPEHARRWISWAANCLVDGGEILASIWPNQTRPEGEIEYQYLKSWIATWAEVYELEYRPKYEIPPFEIASELYSQSGELARSPRAGRLIKIKMKRKPALTKTTPGHDTWTRFIFNNYQVAVRNRPGTSTETTLNKLPNASGWIWPYVSRRAPHREKIDVWSSRNEVAQAKNPPLLINSLRSLISSSTEVDFKSALSDFPVLLEWKIPLPPYWRTQEWLHQQ